MKETKLKIRTAFLTAAVLLIVGTVVYTLTNRPVKIRVLILPKFEVGEMSGDYIGEAQCFYDEYCVGAKEYDLKNVEGNKLYVKDGIALYVTGIGKVTAAANLTEILEDDRFDLSGAYILGTGCAGGSCGYAVLGDVIIGTAAADFDLGHHADPREMENGAESKWFRDSDYDSAAFKILNGELAEKAYLCSKDLELLTTEKTKAAMNAEFGGAEWATRAPMVLKGTIVTSDNYWKGEYDHHDAVRIAAEYGCPDPYMACDMEDVALAVVAEKYGMLDRLILLRTVVDEDVFTAGSTPESLWEADGGDGLTSDESKEAFDIFETAMKNNFEVGRRIIEMLTVTATMKQSS